MVRLLGLNRFGSDPSPREITRTNPITGGESSGVGENGWLIRFFDSSFFCEWIAVSYLYKHDHAGVRDYLCNRMYTLPLAGLENYLFQICYMLVHKPSPSLDKFVIDTCSKSLRISLKVHWFLMAELEDSEDNEGISRIQEKCQIAATLMGEWPPLSRSGFVQSSTPSSPKSHPVLNRLLSSKQKLMSLASSPASTPALSSPVEEKLSNSEENTLLKKLMPGPKVRDAFFFRKSMEEEEERDKDGFFKRLLRDSKDKEEEDGDNDGFFKRLIRDSKEKEEEDGDKDGFFKRLLRDSKDEDDQELCSSSDGFLKRLFRDKEEKLREEDEKDKEGFFRRIFKDKTNEEKNEEEGRGSRSFEEEEKESFFHKLFKDKNEERKDNANERNKEEHKSNRSSDEDDNESFFGRIFKDKNNEKKDGGHDRINEEEDKGMRSIEDDDRDRFFRRFFKDKTDDKRVIGHDRNEHEKCRSTEDAEKEGFFRKIFKDKHDQERKDEGHVKSEEHSKCNGSFEEEETSEFLSFRRLFRVHPEDGKSAGVNTNPGSPLDSSPGTENFFRRLFRDRYRSVEDSELFGPKTRTEV